VRGEKIYESGPGTLEPSRSPTRLDRAGVLADGGLLDLMTESLLREADLVLAEAEIVGLAQHKRLGILHVA
jgi:hypothetical protein